MNRYTSVDSVDDIHIHNSLGGTMDAQVATYLFPWALWYWEYYRKLFIADKSLSITTLFRNQDRKQITKKPVAMQFKWISENPKNTTRLIKGMDYILEIIIHGAI